jgi:hypothetical protein
VLTGSFYWGIVAKAFSKRSGRCEILLMAVGMFVFYISRRLVVVQKVLICGSRFYSDFHKVLSYVEGLEDAVIISGGARGADTLAVRAAKACGLQFREYPAEWQKYGKKAGVLRNQKMLDMEKPDLVVAFTPDLEQSRGTHDMVKRAERSGVAVVVFS